MNKAVLAMLSLALLASCGINKVSRTMTSKKVYHNFFVGNDINQWYIHPITLNADDSRLLMDFTFRDSIAGDGAVSIKYSIISEVNFDTPQNLDILTGTGSKIEIRNSDKVFVERTGKYLHYRYINTITLDEFKTTVKDLKDVRLSDGKAVFLPSKDTEKRLDEIDFQVLQLIEKY